MTYRIRKGHHPCRGDGRDERSLTRSDDCWELRTPLLYLRKTSNTAACTPKNASKDNGKTIDRAALLSRGEAPGLMQDSGLVTVSQPQRSMAAELLSSKPCAATAMPGAKERHYLILAESQRAGIKANSWPPRFSPQPRILLVHNELGAPQVS
jgi:hypothetical protein